MTELIPWAAAAAGARFEGRSTTLLGTSAPGFAAVFTGLKYPDVCGNVVAISGAFMFGPDGKVGPVEQPPGESWLARQCQAAEHLPGRSILDVGLFERLNPRFEIVAANRRVRDVLQAKGATVTYREIPGGHDMAWWRGSVAEALIALAKPPVR